MILSIMGFAGTGKTLLGVYFSARYKYLGNYEIISNLKKLSFKDYDVEKDFILLVDSIRSNRNLLPEKKLLFVDEIQQYLDSRESATSKNKKLTRYFYQIRKFGFDFIYTLQDFHSVDIRLRRITEYFVLPSYDKRNKILSYELYGVDEELITTRSIRIPDKLFNMYDTYEDIDNSVILL